MLKDVRRGFPGVSGALLAPQTHDLTAAAPFFSHRFTNDKLKHALAARGKLVSWISEGIFEGGFPGVGGALLAPQTHVLTAAARLRTDLLRASFQ